jgi:hypothetical protein
MIKEVNHYYCTNCNKKSILTLVNDISNCTEVYFKCLGVELGVRESYLYVISDAWIKKFVSAY